MRIFTRQNRKNYVRIALVVLLCGASVYGWSKYRTLRDIKLATQANTALMDSFIQDQELTVDQRWALIQKAKNANDGLTESQRREVERQSWEVIRSEFNRKVDAFLALSSRGEKNAFIDEELDRWESLKKDMKEVAKREKQSRGEADSKQQTAERGGPPWARGKNGPNNSKMRAILDRTSPTERAKFTEFMMAVMARKMQRNLLSR